MISYDKIIQDLKDERQIILCKAKEGRLGTDLARGALHMLDKLIMKYEDDMEG
ncbi:hypothetical protein [Oceanobacillus sp. FSL K6-0251]|uniref:hypothetical protein n=1 Tax=Oceanobacillus sp. FSL K6-0251 TaxID=2921602 RepID=UPI0030F640A2